MEVSEKYLREIVKNALEEVVEDIETEHLYRTYLKEDFRRKHHKAETLNEDVMARLYGVRTNGNAIVKINEITIDRLLKKHGNNGMVCISANRSDKDKAYNDKATQSLINDLKNSSYSYLPVYGGYRGTNGVEDDYEPSFIIFNYDTESNPTNFQNLFDFAISMCKKYQQDSVLIKEPNNAPIYVDSNGNKVNSTESNKVWKNDPRQAFFTSLKNKTNVDAEMKQKIMGMFKTYCNKNHIPKTEDNFKRFEYEHWNDIAKIGKRYTYDIQFECYVNPMPSQLTEQMRRKGEIMVWD